MTTRPARRIALIQVVIVCACFLFTALAPRAGAATLIMPLGKGNARHVMDWALANGAGIVGHGPGGSLILVNTRPGFALRALHDGALTIAVPEILCSEAST